ncbi:hypothetical protein GGI25_002526 [Coemansia spiralis]|uniref:Guanine nucleotide-binding protein-like 1 n=2 Tax=Coemansia TaxID=4863 RepID=A0A9W8G3I9_9FUNG|nr:hypothetical protein EDC05_002471 [Coemansia umbellata]KAJ2622910.1 hypothetical protein GGI26_002876 [Coemansia sp. RSA 1358]KAJ2678175.1 hypothetical protein GGI25_002526 [Coemansia spiralis]
MVGHRKKPFSVKQKKAQLQAKRAQKRDQEDSDDARPNRLASAKQSTPDGGRNRLTSHFDKLTRVEIDANKKQSMQPIDRLPPDALTMSFDDAYSADVAIPVRPHWKYGESRGTVERREAEYFAQWLDNLNELKETSLYEKNLEVWRQLWRVVEISDILLLVIDIRQPVLHFPPSLYNYVTEMGKPLVVVLNKTDLVSQDTVRAWMHYFRKQFPEVILTTFCCYRDQKPLINDMSVGEARVKSKRPRKRVHDSTLVGGLFEACRSVCDPQKLALVDWDTLIARYKAPADIESEEEGGESDGSDGEGDVEQGDVEQGDVEQEEPKDDGAHGESVSSKYVTLGLVGHPNVGKSTVINSIMNRTVVSTSRTPGHTKHFQTIHVTPTLRLCDCPGLVFPCVVTRPLQVLAGLYNIAQVQEPYTSVMYLAERVPLERILGLRLPEDTTKWSAWAICEAFAIDRGFYTSKAARPDVYRAALHILRWELDGRILLSFKPPGFFHDYSYLKDGSVDNGATADQQHKDNGDNASRGRSDDSSNEEPSDNDRQPIAQQSMFAVLGEEDC